MHYSWVDASNTAIGFVGSGGSVLCALLDVRLSWLIGKQVQLLGIGVHNRLLLLRAAHGVFIQDALKLAIRDAIALCDIMVQTLQRVVVVHHFLENIVLHGADLQHIGSNSLVRRVVNTLALVIACLLHGFPHQALPLFIREGSGIANISLHSFTLRSFLLHGLDVREHIIVLAAHPHLSHIGLCLILGVECLVL